MPKRRPHLMMEGQGARDSPEGAGHGTLAREQVARAGSGPEVGGMTKEDKRPTITLKSGAIVDARAAVAIVQQLRVTLSLHPDQFHSLLALAEGRPGDADPRHF